MKRPLVSPAAKQWARVLTGLGLVGACTVVDKGDYTFTDATGGSGGDGGTASGGKGGSSSGASGKGGTGTSGEAGESSGAMGGTGGKGGSAGDAGGGGGGEGGLCDPNPCEHGGTCTSDGVRTTCDCAPGYEGPTCQTDIDECNPNPCTHGETCRDLVGDFVCACMPIDTGKSCELPRFQPIFSPAGNMVPSVISGVSADGTVVVGHFIGTGGLERPFYWTNQTGAQPLQIPFSVRTDVNVFATTVSGDGTAWAGYYRGTNATDPNNPIAGTLTSSRTLPIPPNALGGEVFDLDATGAKAVGQFVDMMNSPHAAQWTDQTMPPDVLTSPFGMGLPSAAGAVTRDGTIVTGYAKESATSSLIVSWANQGTTAPPNRRLPMSGWSALVHGVSADGDFAVGTLSDGAGAGHFAMATQSSSALNIAPMDGAAPAISNAWDVNDDGTVIVGDATFNSMGMTTSQACLWTRSSSQMLISYKGTVVDALRSTGVNLPTNWTLTAAHGVSADGKIVVGQGTDQMGQVVGFIARLP